jgi:hypothetical protein
MQGKADNLYGGGSLRIVSNNISRRQEANELTVVVLVVVVGVVVC